MTSDLEVALTFEVLRISGAVTATELKLSFGNAEKDLKFDLTEAAHLTGDSPSLFSASLAPAKRLAKL